MTEQTDCGLLLRRYEVLRSLRQYLQVQSQGHAIKHLEERGVETIFLNRMRQGHCQSDAHWSRFKGDVGKTSEGWDGAQMGFSELIDIIELN